MEKRSSLAKKKKGSKITTYGVGGDLTSTGNVSGNFICTWKLKNFSKLDYACGSCFFSRYIRTGANKYDKWYLKLYPGGNSAHNAGCVYLSVCSSNHCAQKIKLKASLELRNIEDKIIRAMSYEKFFDCSKGFGYSLIKRATLLRKLKKDVLVVQVKATYTLAFVTSADGKTEHYPEMNSELKGNDMRRLQIKQKGTDVVISVSGDDIPAHYSVLAAQSKVFAAMFEHDTTEKSYRRVIIKDFDVDSVKAVLQFLYTGSVRSLTIDLAKDLLRAADKYDIENLKIYCSNYLISRFDTDNIGSIVVTADAYNAAKLRVKAIQFVCKHMNVLEFAESVSSAFPIRDRLMLDIIKCMPKRE